MFSVGISNWRVIINSKAAQEQGQRLKKNIPEGGIDVWDWSKEISTRNAPGTTKF